MTGIRRPRLVTALLALGLLLSASGAAAVLTQRQMRLRGALDGLPAPDLPPRQPILGVTADLTQYDSAALAENLDLIAAAGFVWVRQTFAWSEIEAEPGAFDWTTYDTIVSEAASRGLRLIAVLEQPPGWAAPQPTAPPDDLQDFEQFAGAVAGRYRDEIDLYQVWDEPNLSSGWGGQPPSAVGYAALLQAAYTAIHSADPTATVLTGGLAPTSETGPDNLSDVLYLRGLYENGAAPFFDGVAGKPYGFDTGPDDRRAHPGLLNFSRIVLLREEMVRHGDARKTLWASQAGWNALPAGWQGRPSVWGQTTPQQQAEWTLAAYRRALVEWPWAGGVILENWQPRAGEDDPRWGFALRDPVGNLSLTYTAVQQEAGLINGALWPGVYPAAAPLAAYSGEWEFSELGADIVENGGSAVDVPFAGDTLAVMVRRDNYRAYLYVTIDGQPPSLLPQDERGAYLVLTSADYQPHLEAIPVATGLDPSRLHTAHIEAERGWDQWALAGFAVGSQVDTTGYDAVLAGLGIVCVGILVALARAGRGMGWQMVPARLVAWITARLGAGIHLALSLAAALAVWVGAALTWGGAIPDVLRRLGDGPSLLITALTAGVFYFSPWLVLTIVALIVLFILIYARPEAGLALVMFFTPYYLLPRLLFDRAFSMAEVTSLLLLAAWTLRMLTALREKGWPGIRSLWARMTGLDRAVALFIGISIVSLSWADLLGVAVTELRQMVLEPAVVYLVLRTMPLTARDRGRIVDMLVLTGVIVALVGFYQMATGIDVITAEAGARRLKSVFGTPNNAALFLERIVPIAAAVALTGGNRLRRWLYGAAGAVMLIATGLTLSKGALLLGLPAGFAMIVMLWAGRAGVIAVLVGAALEVLALIPLSRIPRFAGLIDFSSGTSTSFFRLQLWQSTLRMIRDHPITGVGLDQFLYQYRSRYILPAAWQQPDLSQPHNFLLNYWVRLGVFGLAAGIWIQVAFWRAALATQRRLRSSSPALWGLAVGLMGSMAAFIAHGMVDAVHFVIDLAFIFYMTLGLMHQLGEEGIVDGGRGQPPEAAAG
jgi:O-antigen ligase